MAKGSGDLGAFSARAGAIADAIERDLKQFTTDIVAGVAGEVAARTPVDTALARSNWRTNVGSPSNGILFPYKSYPSRWRATTRSGKLGKGGKFTERVNTRGVVEQARVEMIRHRPDQPVFITNNVEYIDALNKGTSPQSPAGFVEAGVSIGADKAARKFRFLHLRKV